MAIHFNKSLLESLLLMAQPFAELRPDAKDLTQTLANQTGDEVNLDENAQIQLASIIKGVTIRTWKPYSEKLQIPESPLQEQLGKYLTTSKHEPFFLSIPNFHLRFEGYSHSDTFVTLVVGHLDTVDLFKQIKESIIASDQKPFGELMEALDGEILKTTSEIDRLYNYPDIEHANDLLDRTQRTSSRLRSLAREVTLASDQSSLMQALSVLIPPEDQIPRITARRIPPSDSSIIYQVGEIIPALVRHRLDIPGLPQDMGYLQHQLPNVQLVLADIKRARKYDRDYEGTVISPTGSGKSHVMKLLIPIMAKEKLLDFSLGQKVIFTVHTKAQAKNLKRSLQKELGAWFAATYPHIKGGLNISTVMGPDKDMSGHIAIVSIPTLAANRGSGLWEDLLDELIEKNQEIVFINKDEIHHDEADSWQYFDEELRKRFPKAYKKGTTATPKGSEKNPLLHIKPIDLFTTQALPPVELVEVYSGILLDSLGTTTIARELDEKGLTALINTTQATSPAFDQLKKSPYKELRNGKMGFSPTLINSQNKILLMGDTLRYKEFFEAPENTLDDQGPRRIGIIGAHYIDDRDLPDFAKSLTVKKAGSFISDYQLPETRDALFPEAHALIRSYQKGLIKNQAVAKLVKEAIEQETLIDQDPHTATPQSMTGKEVYNLLAEYMGGMPLADNQEYSTTLHQLALEQLRNHRFDGQSKKSRNDALIGMVWGDMDKQARDLIEAASEAKILEAVSNIDALGEAYDAPHIKNMVDFKVTFSSIKKGQNAGRNTRWEHGTEVDHNGRLLTPAGTDGFYRRYNIQVIHTLTDGRRLALMRDAYGFPHTQVKRTGKITAQEGDENTDPKKIKPRVKEIANDVDWQAVTEALQKLINEDKRFEGDPSLLSEYIGHDINDLLGELYEKPVKDAYKILQRICTLLLVDRHFLDEHYKKGIKKVPNMDRSMAVDALLKGVDVFLREENYVLSTQDSYTFDVDLGIQKGTLEISKNDINNLRKNTISDTALKTMMRGIYHYLHARKGSIPTAAGILRDLSDASDVLWGGYFKVDQTLFSLSQMDRTAFERVIRLANIFEVPRPPNQPPFYLKGHLDATGAISNLRISLNPATRGRLKDDFEISFEWNYVENQWTIQNKGLRSANVAHALKHLGFITPQSPEPLSVEALPEPSPLTSHISDTKFLKPDASSHPLEAFLRTHQELFEKWGGPTLQEAKEKRSPAYVVFADQGPISIHHLGELKNHLSLGDWRRFVLELPIEVLNLTPAINKKLSGHGVAVFRDLLLIPKSDWLYHTHGIGADTVHALEEALKPYGCQLSYKGFISLDQVFIQPAAENKLLLTLDHLSFSPDEKSHSIDMTERIRNQLVLVSDKLLYVGELIRIREFDLLKTRNLGKKSISVIKDALQGLGLYFGMLIDDGLSQSKMQDIFDQPLNVLGFSNDWQLKINTLQINLVGDLLKKIFSEEVVLDDVNQGIFFAQAGLSRLMRSEDEITSIQEHLASWVPHTHTPPPALSTKTTIAQVTTNLLEMGFSTDAKKIFEELDAIYLGDLVLHKESELLRAMAISKVDGRLLMKEIISKLEFHGLHLGMSQMDWIPQATLPTIIAMFNRGQWLRSQFGFGLRKALADIGIFVNLNKNLFSLVSEMPLSVRSANCLDKANIFTIFHLVTIAQSDLLKFKNFGRKSLNEIDDILSEMGLSTGVDPYELLGLTRLQDTGTQETNTLIVQPQPQHNHPSTQLTNPHWVEIKWGGHTWKTAAMDNHFADGNFPIDSLADAIQNGAPAQDEVIAVPLAIEPESKINQPQALDEILMPDLRTQPAQLDPWIDNILKIMMQDMRPVYLVYPETTEDHAKFFVTQDIAAAIRKLPQQDKLALPLSYFFDHNTYFVTSGYSKKNPAPRTIGDFIHDMGHSSDHSYLDEWLGRIGLRRNKFDKILEMPVDNMNEFPRRYVHIDPTISSLKSLGLKTIGEVASLYFDGKLNLLSERLSFMKRIMENLGIYPLVQSNEAPVSELTGISWMKMEFKRGALKIYPANTTKHDVRLVMENMAELFKKRAEALKKSIPEEPDEELEMWKSVVPAMVEVLTRNLTKKPATETKPTLVNKVPANYQPSLPQILTPSQKPLRPIRTWKPAVRFQNFMTRVR